MKTVIQRGQEWIGDERTEFRVVKVLSVNQRQVWYCSGGYRFQIPLEHFLNLYTLKKGP